MVLHPTPLGSPSTLAWRWFQQETTGFSRHRSGPPTDQASRQPKPPVFDRLARPRVYLDGGPIGPGFAVSRLRFGHPSGTTPPESPQSRLPPLPTSRRLNTPRRSRAVSKSGGRLKLYYHDESGFSPALSQGYSWRLPGLRKPIPYEEPQQRQSNVEAAYDPNGRAPRQGCRRSSDDLLAYLKSLLRMVKPRVLDNLPATISARLSKASVGRRRNKGAICTTCGRRARS